MTTWKPCMVRMRAATATPSALSANAKRNTIGINSTTPIRVSFTPTSGASTRITSPWSIA